MISRPSAQRSRRGALYSGLDGSGGPHRRLATNDCIHAFAADVWFVVGADEGCARSKTTPGPTRFGFVAKSVLLGPEPE